MHIELIPYAFGELFSYACFAYAGHLAWRVVRAYERRHDHAADLVLMRGRLGSLEQALTEIEERVTDAEDGQRFVTRLLEDRAGPTRPHHERGESE
jgi:hypothetical protein